MSNHVLMHWFTLIAAVLILAGVLLVEKTGKTILSVFLPLLSLSWAASVLRFDFFIHRQAAYLRQLESQVQDKTSVPSWDTWKASLRSTAFVVPIADVIATTVIVVPTLYLLFGPAQEYFTARSWRWGKLFAVAVSAILILMLLSLAAVPKLASY